jgi:hypothetical protein
VGVALDGVSGKSVGLASSYKYDVQYRNLTRKAVEISRPKICCTSSYGNLQ